MNHLSSICSGINPFINRANSGAEKLRLYGNRTACAGNGCVFQSPGFVPSRAIQPGYTATPGATKPP